MLLRSGAVEHSPTVVFRNSYAVSVNALGHIAGKHCGARLSRLGVGFALSNPFTKRALISSYKYLYNSAYRFLTP